MWVLRFKVTYAHLSYNMIEFKVGDRVLVSSKTMTTPTDRDTKWKLRDQWYGPLTVTETFIADGGKGPISHRLKLPHQWKIYDVFHVSKLK